MFELKDRLGTHGGHVFDRVLVADVVGALDRVIHMPAPVVIGIRAGDGTGNAALGGYRVGPRGENLGNNSRLVPGLSQLERGAHTSTAAAYDYTVEGNGPHDLSTLP